MKSISKGYAITLILFLLLGVGYCGVSKILHFQGRVTDINGKPDPGKFDITFSIYNSSTEGTALWTETQSVTTDENGIYSILLGTTSSIDIDFNEDYWLGVKVGSDDEMTPRFRLARSAYCFNSDRLDGKDSTEFMDIVDDYGRSGVALNLYEGSIKLCDKYLGITTKAADSDKLDGMDSTEFLVPAGDFGRSGVTTDLYESGTKLSDKYLGKTSKASDSDKLDGYNSGNSSGQIPINNGTLCANLNADKLDGKDSSQLVTKIIAGDNITIDPVEGIGNVTINSISSAGPSGDTQIMVSPMKIIDEDRDKADLIFTADAANGHLIVHPVTGSDARGYIPVDIPSYLLGKSQKLKSISVTYKINNPGPRINDTRVICFKSDGTKVDLIGDTTDRTSTSYENYSINPKTPPLIDGAISIRFSFCFSGGSGQSNEIYIGMISITIGE